MPHHTANKQALEQRSPDNLRQVYAEKARELEENFDENRALDDEYEEKVQEYENQSYVDTGINPRSRSGIDHVRDFKKRLLAGGYNYEPVPIRPSRPNFEIPRLRNYDVHKSIGVMPEKPNPADFDLSDRTQAKKYHVANIRYEESKQNYRTGKGWDSYIRDIRAFDNAGNDQKRRKYETDVENYLQAKQRIESNTGLGLGAYSGIIKSFEALQGERSQYIAANKNNPKFDEGRYLGSTDVRYVYGPIVIRSRLRGKPINLRTYEKYLRGNEQQRQRSNELANKRAIVDARQARKDYASDPRGLFSTIQNFQGKDHETFAGFTEDFRRRKNIAQGQTNELFFTFKGGLNLTRASQKKRTGFFFEPERIKDNAGQPVPEKTDVNVIYDFVNSYKSTSKIPYTVLRGKIEESGVPQTKEGKELLLALTADPKVTTYRVETETVRDKKTGEFYNFKTGEGDLSFGQKISDIKELRQSERPISFSQFVNEKQIVPFGPYKPSVGDNYKTRYEETDYLKNLNPPQSFLDSFTKRGISNIVATGISLPQIADNLRTGQKNPTFWDEQKAKGNVGMSIFDALISDSVDTILRGNIKEKNKQYSPFMLFSPVAGAALLTQGDHVDQYKRDNKDLIGSIAGDVSFETAFFFTTYGIGTGAKSLFTGIKAAKNFNRAQDSALEISKRLSSGADNVPVIPTRTRDPNKIIHIVGKETQMDGNNLIGFIQTFTKKGSDIQAITVPKYTKAQNYIEKVAVLGQGKTKYADKSFKTNFWQRDLTEPNNLPRSDFFTKTDSFETFKKARLDIADYTRLKKYNIGNTDLFKNKVSKRVDDLDGYKIKPKSDTPYDLRVSESQIVSKKLGTKKTGFRSIETKTNPKGFFESLVKKDIIPDSYITDPIEKSRFLTKKPIDRSAVPQYDRIDNLGSWLKKGSSQFLSEKFYEKGKGTVNYLSKNMLKNEPIQKKEFGKSDWNIGGKGGKGSGTGTGSGSGQIVLKQQITKAGNVYRTIQKPESRPFKLPIPFRSGQVAETEKEKQKKDKISKDAMLVKSPIQGFTSMYKQTPRVPVPKIQQPKIEPMIKPKFDNVFVQKQSQGLDVGSVTIPKTKSEIVPRLDDVVIPKTVSAFVQIPRQKPRTGLSTVFIQQPRQKSDTTFKVPPIPFVKLDDPPPRRPVPLFIPDLFDTEDEKKKKKKKLGIKYFGSNLPKHSFIREHWDKPDIFTAKSEPMIDFLLGDKKTRPKSGKKKKGNISLISESTLYQKQKQKKRSKGGFFGF